MTYLDFHLVFTIPLFCLLFWLNRNNRIFQSRKSFLGAALLVFLAVFYTTPWDSYLIQKQIWTYSMDNILFTIYWIPIEEYFFFIIQTLIGCLFTAWLLAKQKTIHSPIMEISRTNIFIFMFFLFSLCSAYAVFPDQQEFHYLKLILFWALPIVLLQISLGWHVLFNHIKVLLFALTALSLYFWTADSIAIHQQIWSFPPQTISGYKILGILPIEEALFFLLTNLMVIQGYILFTQVRFSNNSESKVLG